MIDIPLSLYVHFPWCVKKCPYCDFNSHEISGTAPADEYIEKLIEDLDSEKHDEERSSLASIFLGGGTPSLFGPISIHRLLEAVGSRFDIEDIEITIEANPGTFDQQNFQGYADSGVNRLSLGAQSFDNGSLEALGRIHQAAEIFRAFEGARNAGFNRINIDLMYGLPGQTTTAALNDLRTAISLNPEHISWYQLTIEKNTYFYRFPPDLPDEDTIYSTFEAGGDLLESSGYSQYEISAWAKPNESAKHNLNYWQFGDYLGIGAGAHSKLTDLSQSRVLRYSRSRQPDDYMKSTNGGSRVGYRVLSTDDLIGEYVMNTLRLRTGFELQDFTNRTGLAPELLDQPLQQLLERELLELDNSRVRATALGRRFLDSVVAEFFSFRSDQHA